MSDPIHRHLDGDLPAQELSPSERARAREMDALLGRAAAHLRAAPAPDLTARVMAALPQAAPAPAPLWRRAAGWLWAPRRVSFALRPAYALGGALAAVTALALVPAGGAPPAAAPGLAPTLPVQMAAAPAAAPPVYVQFRLEVDGASDVRLAGTFTGWEPRHVLDETAPGVWTALVPLAPGVHDYAFVVDGERWLADPAAPRVDDGFGGKNSRISLPALRAAA